MLPKVLPHEVQLRKYTNHFFIVGYKFSIYSNTGFKFGRHCHSHLLPLHCGIFYALVDSQLRSSPRL